LNALARIAQDSLDDATRVQLYQEYLEKVVDTVREGLLVLDQRFYIQFANKSFYDMFTVTPEETIGHYIYHLGNSQWDIPKLHYLLEQVLPDNVVFNDFEIEHDFPSTGHRVMLLNARRVDHIQLILLAIEDITDKWRTLRALKALNETLEERVEKRTKQVQGLAAQLLTAEQKERGRISQVLHDDLQQQLVSMRIQLTLLRNRTQEETLLKEIDQLTAQVAVAIKTTRSLSVELSPPLLYDQGLVEAIRWLATQMQQLYGLEVEVEAKGSFPVLNKDRHVLLFQVVRELLFNVVKHAGVSDAQVIVTIQRTDNEYRIDVVDQGVGFGPDQLLRGGIPWGGQGLVNAHERLRLLNGHLEFESTPGVGTRAIVYMPTESPPVS
jgi:signal transduction histidine kinase